MKNISYAATIAGFILFIGGGGSLGVTGCSSAANPGFGNGDDGGGVTHSDSGTHHDGGGTGGEGGGGFDSGGGGNDSGGGSGDCTAFCMKESAVTGCPSQSACEATCQMSVAQAGNCASQLSAVLQCGATTGMIASCSGSQAMISGCNTQISALTACLGMGSGDGGMMTGSGTCRQLITCLNACAANDQTCVNTCFGMASAPAQTDFNALETCLFGTGTGGACGAQCPNGAGCMSCVSMAQMQGGACYTQLQTCSTQM